MKDLLDAFSPIPSPILSDVMDRLPGTYSLRPMHGKGKLIGRALTVKVPAGDNLYIHRALRDAQDGDVLIVDGGGAIDRALIGEIMLCIARSKGVRGYVINGAIRDVGAFEAQGFPCFAKGVSHRGPYKHGPGRIGEPVSIDGSVVCTGDIVVGDEDGVVFVSVDEADKVLKLAEQKMRQEQEIMAQIHAGKYDDSWVVSEGAA